MYALQKPVVVRLNLCGSALTDFTQLIRIQTIESVCRLDLSTNTFLFADTYLANQMLTASFFVQPYIPFIFIPSVEAVEMLLYALHTRDKYSILLALLFDLQ